MKKMITKEVGKMDEIQQNVFREICPYCKKEITSLHKGQLDYNFKAHLISCPKKNAAQ